MALQVNQVLQKHELNAKINANVKDEGRKQSFTYDHYHTN